MCTCRERERQRENRRNKMSIERDQEKERQRPREKEKESENKIEREGDKEQQIKRLCIKGLRVFKGLDPILPHGGPLHFVSDWGHSEDWEDSGDWIRFGWDWGHPLPFDLHGLGYDLGDSLPCYVK